MAESGWQVNNSSWLGVHAIHHGCNAEDFATWIELGVDVNLIESEFQSTALGWAARRGNLEYAKLLLQNGADPNLAGEPWATPIEWAKRRGHGEIVELLS